MKDTSIHSCTDDLPELVDDDPAQAARCTALWASVAQAAIEDAVRRGAACFVYLSTPDFREVLELAGVDPDQVDEAARRIRAQVLAARRGEVLQAKPKHRTRPKA